MRVALIIPSIKKYGPIVFTDYLVKSLIGIVEYVEVFYFNSHSDDDVLVDFHCKVTKLNFFRRHDFSNFDVIHSTMLKPDLYVAFHKLNGHKTCISSMHNYIYDDLKMLHPFLKSFLITKIWYAALGCFKNIIVSSDAMLDYYQERLSSSTRFNVIQYGIPQTLIESSKVPEHDILDKLRKKYMILGSCGLLIKRKGFNQLVELLNNNSDIAVVIIGSGPELSNLRDSAIKYGVSERLLLMGFKDRYLEYYQYFDVFVMCSFSEGFGIAMLEAMSLKIPLLCSNLDIYKGTLDQKRVCFFEPGNINSLQNALIEVKNHKIFYSASAYDVFSEFFSLDIMGSNHLKFYKACVSRTLIR